MKYLKKFENILTPTLLSCFDDLENSNFNIEPIHYFVSISPKLPEFFELDENMKDDIISSIGKAEQIGYFLERIRMYNGIVGHVDYYSTNTFDDFKNNLNFERRSGNFRFDHLTKIIIFFRQTNPI